MSSVSGRNWQSFVLCARAFSNSQPLIVFIVDVNVKASAMSLSFALRCSFAVVALFALVSWARARQFLRACNQHTNKHFFLQIANADDTLINKTDVNANLKIGEVHVLANTVMPSTFPTTLRVKFQPGPVAHALNNALAEQQQNIASVDAAAANIVASDGPTTTKSADAHHNSTTTVVKTAVSNDATIAPLVPTTSPSTVAIVVKVDSSDATVATKKIVTKRPRPVVVATETIEHLDSVRRDVDATISPTGIAVTSIGGRTGESR